MRGFWAVTLFLLGLFLVYPGMFIWPFAMVSVVMLGGAIAIASWDADVRQRPVAKIFSWMAGFVLVIEAALGILIRFFA